MSLSFPLARSVYHRPLGEQRLNPLADLGDQRVAIGHLHPGGLDRLRRRGC